MIAGCEIWVLFGNLECLIVRHLFVPVGARLKEFY